MFQYSPCPCFSGSSHRNRRLVPRRPSLPLTPTRNIPPRGLFSGFPTCRRRLLEENQKKRGLHTLFFVFLLFYLISVWLRELFFYSFYFLFLAIFFPTQPFRPIPATPSCAVTGARYGLALGKNESAMFRVEQENDLFDRLLGASGKR